MVFAVKNCSSSNGIGIARGGRFTDFFEEI